MVIFIPSNSQSVKKITWKKSNPRNYKVGPLVLKNGGINPNAFYDLLIMGQIMAKKKPEGCRRLRLWRPQNRPDLRNIPEILWQPTTIPAFFFWEQDVMLWCCWKKIWVSSLGSGDRKHHFLRSTSIFFLEHLKSCNTPKKPLNPLAMQWCISVKNLVIPPHDFHAVSLFC